MNVKETVKKSCLPAVTALSSAALAAPAWAAEGTVVTASDWSSVISALTAQISVSTIIAALTTFVAAGIGIVFMWWGLRKGIRSLMAAFRKGRMSV